MFPGGGESEYNGIVENISYSKLKGKSFVITFVESGGKAKG